MLHQLAACAVCMSTEYLPCFEHPDDPANHARHICWRCHDHITGRAHRHPEWCPPCAPAPTLF